MSIQRHKEKSALARGVGWGVGGERERERERGRDPQPLDSSFYVPPHLSWGCPMKIRLASSVACST